MCCSYMLFDGTSIRVVVYMTTGKDGCYMGTIIIKINIAPNNEKNKQTTTTTTTTKRQQNNRYINRQSIDIIESGWEQNLRQLFYLN